MSAKNKAAPSAASVVIVVVVVAVASNLFLPPSFYPFSYRSSSVESFESPLRLPPRAAEMPPRAPPPPRPLRWKGGIGNEMTAFLSRLSWR